MSSTTVAIDVDGHHITGIATESAVEHLPLVVALHGASYTSAYGAAMLLVRPDQQCRVAVHLDVSRRTRRATRARPSDWQVNPPTCLLQMQRSAV